MDTHYPPLDDRTVWGVSIICRMLRTDPNYLDAPDCPYPAETRRYLAAIGGLAAATPAPAVPAALEVADAEAVLSLDDLETQIARLLRDLKDFGEHLQQGDVAGHNTYFRTSAALIEKLLTMKEKAGGLRQVGEFQEKVLAFVDEVLTPDQRTRLMDRLGAYLGAPA